MKKNIICEGKTCFGEHKKLNVICNKSDCKYWHKKPECQNCILIAADEGERTLQEIGEMFGVTRMRVCQIEKQILKKLSGNKGLVS